MYKGGLIHVCPPYKAKNHLSVPLFQYSPGIVCVWPWEYGFHRGPCRPSHSHWLRIVPWLTKYDEGPNEIYLSRTLCPPSAVSSAIGEVASITPFTCGLHTGGGATPTQLFELIDAEYVLRLAKTSLTGITRLSTYV